MYKIIPFIWYELNENETFFQTKSASIVITNKKIITMLKDLERQQQTILDEKTVLNYFESEMVTKVLSFLENNKLLEKIKKTNDKLTNIVLHSDDVEFTKLFEYAFSERFSISYENDISDLEVKDISSDLLIVFLSSFSFKKFERIVQISKIKNIIVKIIFSYNHHIYLSNYYKAEWVNPCPICFFAELESQLRGEVTTGTTNFQTIIDLLYTKSQTFSIKYPLQRDDYFTIIYTIMKNIDSDMSNCELDEVLSIDLNNHSISKDIAYHWGYCDCYE